MVVPGITPSKLMSDDKESHATLQGNTETNILHEFADNTTVHGVFRVVNSRSTKGRLFWVCLCLFAVVMFSVQLHGLFSRYYSYPTTTSFSISRQPVPFPDVTVCNMRNLDIGVLDRMFKIFSSDLSKMSPQQLLAKAVTDFEKAYMKKMLSYLHVWLKFSQSHKEVFLHVFSRTNLIANFDHTLLEMAGVSPWELTLNCQVGRKPCDIDKFKIFYDSYFMTCITFQSKEELFLSSGINNGLSTIALVGGDMVDWEHYGEGDLVEMPGVSQFQHPMSGSEGARVVIHPRGTLPFPRAEGHDVPPGYAASIGLQVVKRNLLGKPYTECESPNKRDSNNYIYRLSSCTGHCIQKQIIETCHCVSSEVPFSSQDLQNMTFCGHVPEPEGNCADYRQDPGEECLAIFQIPNERMRCAQEVGANMAQKDLALECGCVPPCEEPIYETAYSLSKWPAGQELDIMYRDIFQQGTFNQSLHASGNGEDKIKLYTEYFNFSNRHKAMQNFARINVYIADNTVVEANEVKDYSLLQLGSDIGGQLGLWVGMSVLSFGEVFQLLVEAAISIGLYIRHKKRVTQMKNENKKGNFTSKQAWMK